MELDVMAFGAHRDDIELTCAGTVVKLINQGYSVGITDLTAGEMGTRGNAEERQNEAKESTKVLGVMCRENLGIPDANIQSNDENKLKVILVIRKYKPKVIFLPYWMDRHPDHAHASQLVSESAFLAGLAKFHPEIPRHHPQKLIYYMCHYQFEPSFIVDISEQHETKMKAIHCFKSQIFNPNYQGEQTYISSPEYIESIEVRSRYYGGLIGKKHGEPFLIREMVEVNNIMTLI